METEMNQGFHGFKSVDEKEPSRAKSSVRIHYEAQVEVIRKQLGDLEKIRENLGLSQRKICQLLMVDPSAWTRWTKRNENPPPHIYRALQWYMILQEKLPGLTPQYFVGKDPEILHQSALRKIEAESQKRLEFEDAFALQSLQLENRIRELTLKNQDLEKTNQSLQTEIQDLKRRSFWIILSFCVLGAVVALSFLKFRPV
jgi:transcriptional regulator with XRE-family HTH domain